jgi:hypothetical protein
MEDNQGSISQSRGNISGRVQAVLFNDALSQTRNESQITASLRTLLSGPLPISTGSAPLLLPVYLSQIVLTLVAFVVLILAVL